MSKWKGTPVPCDNVTTIEKVYVNTNMSPEEVVSLLSQITYNTENMYTLYATGPNFGKDDILLIMCRDDLYGIMALTNNTMIQMFAYMDGSTEIAEAGFSGWNTDFNGVIEVNAISDTGAGLENDKLSSLFSITPFVKEEDEPKYDWLRELFINEAKPALERHSGSKAPSYEETENEAGGVTVTIGTKGE